MIKLIKRLPNFFKEVKEELTKVNWSSRQELTVAGIIVSIVSFIFTVYIFMVDVGLSHAVQLILR